jgi:kynurenine 3-monooxygenase
MKKASVIGSGLVGSMLALFLAKRNYEVKVYERRPDMRKQKIDGGRSINLALSDRGLKALNKLGLATEVKKMTIPMHGRMVHGIDGSLNYQPYGKEGQYINSISRGGLNELLINEAEKHNNVQFFFEHKSIDVDFKTNEVVIEAAGKNIKTESDLVFGADGAFSAVRNALMKTERFNYSQQYLPHSYKELNMQPDANGNWKMEKNALHIWPRKSFMLIALPNLDGSFTCTLFLAHEGDISFANLQTEAQVTAFFQEYFPDTIELMPNYLEEFFGNPIASLVTVKCFPWTANNKICLLGDAAHAIVPFYGQGMNCGFEDCDVLDDLIDSYQEDWTTILQQFQTLRKPDGDAIADLALRNFIEMRDLVADENFLIRKKIEKAMHERHPEDFVPLYSLVTFGHTRYSEALRLGQLHDTFFSQKENLKTLAETLDTPETLQVLDSWVAALKKLS